jgi:hypothetical protein
MTENRSPQELVLALVRVISGESPRRAAEACLNPQVTIHMDSAIHRGITIWYKWIYLIRNCGRIWNLRMTPHNVRCDLHDPNLVHLSMSWSGTNRSHRRPATAPDVGALRYLVRDGRIVEIWTHKNNYVFIFGEWIRYSIYYRLFLCWAIFYFALLWLRGRDFRSDGENAR